MLKPTITNLAKHIGMTPQGIHKMKNDHPKKFELLWSGWMVHLAKNNELSSVFEEILKG